MTVYQIEEFKGWLLNIIGRKLIFVQALIHVYEGNENISSPQELQLSFESKIRGKLKCGSDGESIVLDSTELKPSDLGEYGKQIVKDISNLSCWQKVIGSPLKEVHLLESMREFCLMGIKFTFENDLSVVMVNLGDEIFIYESLPEEIVQEEEIRYSLIS